MSLETATGGMSKFQPPSRATIPISNHSHKQPMEWDFKDPVPTVLLSNQGWDFKVPTTLVSNHGQDFKVPTAFWSNHSLTSTKHGISKFQPSFRATRGGISKFQPLLNQPWAGFQRSNRFEKQPLKGFQNPECLFEQRFLLATIPKSNHWDGISKIQPSLK